MRLMYTHRAMDDGKFFSCSLIDREPNISLSDLLGAAIFKTHFASTFLMTGRPCSGREKCSAN